MSTFPEQKSFCGKFRLTSTILVETGLHIGGGGERLDIGGLDHPVIRDPLTQYPYLPGSSIKGKLRSILERWLNKPLNRQARTGGLSIYRHECNDVGRWNVEIAEGQHREYEGASDCELCRIFGSTGVDFLAQSNGEFRKDKGRNAPARLIVRDCHLRNAERLEKLKTGLYMTEWKFENGLDRVTAAANPRQVERIPKGAEFEFGIVYTADNEVQIVQDFQHLEIAIAILEDDALGGHGSRGYGKIKFKDFQIFYRGKTEYRNGGNERLVQSAENTSELLGKFDKLAIEINQLMSQNQSLS